MEEVLKDKRFAKIATDQRFRGGGKKQKKVQIDKRFQSMFEDDRFVSKCTVDKRGRPKNFSSKETYQKFYELESSDSEKEDSDSDDGSEDDRKDIVNQDSESEAADANKSSSSGDDNDDDNENDDGDEAKSSDDEDENSSQIGDAPIDPSIKEKLLTSDIDYARGEGNLYSDSSSDESSGDEDEALQEEGFDKWGEMDADAERTEEATTRLAVCNMDWDRVSAQDIFLALDSFCPGTGSVRKVEVYLSDFGAERLKEEDNLGPQELRQRNQDLEDYQDLHKSRKKAAIAEKAAMERVRQYQVNRLKYYYAVAEFDSVESANSVYEECDGMEYELSATRFDLRFIPGDMEFTSPPASACLSRPDPTSYEPKSFFTTALQQGKVELTWDEQDNSRKEQMKKAFDDLENDDFAVNSNLIASSSDEEGAGGEGEDAEDGDIARYRALLFGGGAGDDQNTGGEKEVEGDMEMSWVPDTEHNPTTDQNTDLGPWQKYLEKKKEKRRKKKKEATASDDDEDDDLLSDQDVEDFFEETNSKGKKGKRKRDKKDKKAPVPEETETKVTDLDLLVMDSDDEKSHFDYKTIVEQETKDKSKKRKKWKKNKNKTDEAKNDGFDVNLADDRFAAVFTRPEFNIDPSEQNFKKTKGMQQLIQEKQKRIHTETLPIATATDTDQKKSKKFKHDPEISSSLKSIKTKWGKNAKKRMK